MKIKSKQKKYFDSLSKKADSIVKKIKIKKESKDARKK